jgi:hypothetical protein
MNMGTKLELSPDDAVANAKVCEMDGLWFYATGHKVHHRARVPGEFAPFEAEADALGITEVTVFQLEEGVQLRHVTGHPEFDVISERVG